MANWEHQPPKHPPTCRRRLLPQATGSRSLEVVPGDPERSFELPGEVTGEPSPKPASARQLRVCRSFAVLMLIATLYAALAVVAARARGPLSQSPLAEHSDDRHASVPLHVDAPLPGAGNTPLHCSRIDASVLTLLAECASEPCTQCRTDCCRRARHLPLGWSQATSRRHW
jgi:hypothetical protein